MGFTFIPILPFRYHGPQPFRVPPAAMEVHLPGYSNGTCCLHQNPTMGRHKYPHFVQTRPEVANLQNHNCEHHEARIHVELHVRRSNCIFDEHS